MARSERLSVRGLHVSPNPHSAAPEGALSRCENVILDRIGSARPRPGFKIHANSNNMVVARRLVPWNGDVLLMQSGGAASWLSVPTTDITTDGLTHVTWTGGSASARKNLYVANGDGVRKLTSTSDVIAGPAGIADTAVISGVVATGSSGFCAASSWVGYTVVIKRTDENNLIVRNHGVGHALGRNATSGTRDFAVYVTFGTGVAVGDELELYRTAQATSSDVEREFYLCATHKVESGDFTTYNGDSIGVYAFTDGRSDASLGAALYTNDSREGIEGGNFAPPQWSTLAAFNGSLFGGDMVGPQRFTLAWKEWGDVTGSTTNIGYRSLNGKRTNGSNQITGVTITTLEVGMMLESATSWAGTDPVVITALSGTTATVSTTWSGTTDASPVSLTWLDTIYVQDSTNTLSDAACRFPASTLNYGALVLTGHQAFLATLNAGLSTTRNHPHPVFYGYSTDCYHPATAGGSWTATVVVEERKRGAGAAYVYATNTTGHINPVASSQSATCVTAKDDLNGAIGWSKNDEPEHFTLAAYQPVGNEALPIQRMLPTRAALWIFKEDGLFRLSGSAAPYWSVESYDPTVRLLRPDAAVASNDAIYAWTSRGVIELSDGGSRIISTQIASELDAYQRYHAANARLGVWMAEEPTLRLILLGISPTSATETSEVIYCYHVASGEWSKWTADNGLASIYHMAYDPASTTLIGTRSDGEVVQERLLTDSPAYTSADFSRTITITGTPTTAITISPGSYWTPAVRDAVVQSGAVYVVTAVASSTSFTVHASGLTAASATAYEAFSSTLEWLPVGSPLQDKHWSEAGVGFETQAGLSGLSLTFATERKRSGTAVAKSITYTQPDTAATDTQRPTSIRVLAPRSAALGSRQFPKLTITNALGTWRLSGLGLTFDELSTRVSR